MFSSGERSSKTECGPCGRRREEEKPVRITIDRDSSIPIYSQIEAEIKKNILNNVLVYGTRLPSERQQAANLGVHRNTVIRAYKNLADQQFISSDFEGSVARRDF